MLVGYWSIAGLCVTLGGIIVVLSQGLPTAQVVLGVLSIDSFSVYFAAVFVLVTLLIAISSMYYMADDKNFDTYFGLLLLGTFGMMLVAFSVDLVALFLAWELMNVPSYVLTDSQEGSDVKRGCHKILYPQRSVVRPHNLCNITGVWNHRNH
jgi:NADH-quinone oxidoreductase subunit N